MPSTRPSTRALVAGSLLPLALALAACGGDTSDAEPSAARTAPNGDVFNDADVEFAARVGGSDCVPRLVSPGRLHRAP